MTRKKKKDRESIAERRKDQVNAWIKNAQKIMNLSEWKIEYRGEVPLEYEVDAMIITTENRNAHIKLPLDFFDEEAEEQLARLTHELCHLFFDRFDSLHSGLKAVLSPGEFRLFMALAEDVYEHGVESLVPIFLPVLPIPKFDRE